MATWIIGGLLLILMALAAVYSFRKTKSGGCTGCPNAGGCPHSAGPQGGNHIG